VSPLDQEKVGFPVTAYVSAAIEKSAAKLAAFERTLRSCEEVMECYLMTGAFDYIVRVVASDIAGIERFVMTRLANIEGVRDVSTSITLRRLQYKTVLPVREGGELISDCAGSIRLLEQPARAPSRIAYLEWLC
jgi:Lrp/AsnC family leucine-responsive transcriptional regulator